MGLEEKIHRRIKYHTGLYKSNLTKEISEIADDYAIEFAEWLEKLRSSEIDTIDYDLYLRYNTKELLEIFKKEKGL